MATVKDYVDLIREIQKLNPSTNIELDSKLQNPKNVESFYASVDMNKLVLPPHFSIHPKYGITNQRYVGPFGDPIYISVEDINKVKDNETHDISKIKDSGYTEEEEQKLAKEAAEKAAKEEEKKDGVAPTTNDDTKSNTTTIDFSGKDYVESRRRIVRTTKKIKTTALDLYERIRKGLKYNFTKSEKFKPSEKEETKEKEEIEKLSARYNGKTLDDLTVISKLVKKIEPNEYMMGVLKDFTGESIEDELKEDPHKLAEIMRDVTLMGELHDFAIKDPNFNKEKFEELAMQMVSLRKNNQLACNRILQQVRFGGVTVNQMKFLEERINALGKNFSFTRPNMNNGGPNNGGPGNGGSNNGGQNNGGSNTGTDTPEAVELTEYDKKKAEIINDFNKAKTQILSKLGDYEIAFIDDAAAEGLSFDDPEFIQMLNERAVDKNAIFNYYSDLNNLKNLMASEYYSSLYKALGETEVMFVEDARQLALDPGDEEFRMMMNERTVNKSQILDYYKTMAELQAEIKRDEVKLDKIAKLRDFFSKNYNEQNVIIGSERPADYNSTEVIKKQREAELKEQERLNPKPVEKKDEKESEEKVEEKPKKRIERTDFEKIEDLEDIYKQNYTQENVIIGSERPADYNSTEEIRKLREAELEALAAKNAGRSR